MKLNWGFERFPAEIVTRTYEGSKEIRLPAKQVKVHLGQTTKQAVLGLRGAADVACQIHIAKGLSANAIVAQAAKLQACVGES